MAAIAALPSLFRHERPLGAPTQAMPALKMRPKSLHRFFSSFLQFDSALVNLLSNIPCGLISLFVQGILGIRSEGCFGGVPQEPRIFMFIFFPFFPCS